MDNEKQAMVIAKAIALAENGGKLTYNKLKTGKSGEMKSIFQFTPGTWKLYSKQILGKEEPLNNENELKVVHGKVQKWLDDGYNTEQIASMWNAGEQRPDAYKENWRGTNKYGVKYDTPAYAKKVSNYATQLNKEYDKMFNGVPVNTQINMPQPTTPNNPNTPKDIGGLIKLALNK